MEVEADGSVVILRRRQTRCLFGLLLLDLNRRLPTARLVDSALGQPEDQARAHDGLAHAYHV